MATTTTAQALLDQLGAGPDQRAAAYAVLEATSDAELKGRMDAQKPGHCCTLIYTSGTTGNPKGVMISHDNAVWTAKSNVLHNKAITAGPLRVVSYLPLSHIAAQIVDIHSPLLCIVDFTVGRVF